MGPWPNGAELLANAGSRRERTVCCYHYLSALKEGLVRPKITLGELEDGKGQPHRISWTPRRSPHR